MKILVVSEGKHELGDAEHEGALVVLVRRTLGKPAEFVAERISDPKVRVHWRRGEGQGFVKRALAWIRFAERHDFDALVLVIDQDGYEEREREIATAQSDDRLALPRALGVAIWTFDAWMLADERALSQVLCREISRQKAPEGIRDPKDICRQLLDGGGKPMPQAEFYAAVANAADLNILAQRCPRGFAPLAASLSAL